VRKRGGRLGIRTPDLLHKVDSQRVNEWTPEPSRPLSCVLSAASKPPSPSLRRRQKTLSSPLNRTSAHPSRFNLLVTFPTTPFRTGQAPFGASGSPTLAFVPIGLARHPAHPFRTLNACVCTPSPCIGHYPDHLSTMGTLSP
jgi:hypothetical protein